MKTICLYGISNSGKTTTLALLAKNIDILANSKIICGTLPFDEKDFRVVFELNGLKIGIGSEGDTPHHVKENLEKLISAKCDIIVIAARSKGGTHREIYKICENHEILWLRQRDIYRELNTNPLKKVDKNNLLKLSNQQTADLILGELA